MKKIFPTFWTYGVVFFLLGFLGYSGAEVTVSLDFPIEEVSISTEKEFARIEIPECHYTTTVGFPEIPVMLVHVLIPAQDKFDGVEIIQHETKELAGDFYVFPLQPRRPRNIPEIDFVPPNEDAYKSGNPYPGKLIEYVEEGDLAGYRLVSFSIHPIQYTPETRKLVLHTNMTLSVRHSPLADLPHSIRRSSQAQKVYENLVKQLVVNPIDVESYSPDVQPVDFTSSSPGFEYLIVTTAKKQMPLAFVDLVEWKSRKGVPAVLRTTDWIDTTFNGRDIQEKIRNYLKIAHRDSGLVWVLLGGDEDIIPIRDVWFRSEYGGSDDTIPCDYYYSCLGGSWDYNQNSVFGETEDRVDYYPDVFVGRALASLKGEAIEYCTDRILTYEKYRDQDTGEQLPLEYGVSMLGLGGDVWQENYGCEWIQEYIFDLYTPDRFYLVNMCNRDISFSSALRALNAGFNLVQHTGHGHYCTLCIKGGEACTEIFDCETIGWLTNAPRFIGLFSSIACLIGGFDQEYCIARSFYKNANGGGNIIAESRVGFGSPGGDLDKMGRYIWKHVFNRQSLGVALAWAKVDVGVSGWHDRWMTYTRTLFGDPEASVWLHKPITLSVNHPLEIGPGDDKIYVEVSYFDVPLQDIRVCLFDDNEFYSVKYTHQDGITSFDVGQVKEGNMKITVTWPGCAIPYEYSVPIVASPTEITESSSCVNNKVLLPQNFPNPFSTSTTIAYEMGGTDVTQVALTIYDLVGRQVKNLFRGKQQPGRYTIQWNGKDDLGKTVSNGVYFYRFDCGSEVRVRRMVLLAR